MQLSVSAFVRPSMMLNDCEGTDMNDDSRTSGRLLRFTGEVSAHPTVSLVIPAMNEEKNLPLVAARIPEGEYGSALSAAAPMAPAI